MLWDMARYHNYDIRSPYNREAALLWVANQSAFVFPLDARPLRDLPRRPSAGIAPEALLPRPLDTPRGPARPRRRAPHRGGRPRRRVEGGQVCRFRPPVRRADLRSISPGRPDAVQPVAGPRRGDRTEGTDGVVILDVEVDLRVEHAQPRSDEGNRVHRLISPLRTGETGTGWDDRPRRRRPLSRPVAAADSPPPCPGLDRPMDDAPADVPRRVSEAPGRDAGRQAAEESRILFIDDDDRYGQAAADPLVAPRSDLAAAKVLVVGAGAPRQRGASRTWRCSAWGPSM